HPAPMGLAAVSFVAALALVGLIVGQSYNARLAETNGRLAEVNGELETASGQLKAALQTAESDKAEAQKQRERAENLQARGEGLDLLARRYRYAAEMNLAGRFCSEGGQWFRATDILESQRPQAGQPDLRGFEWYCLWRLSRGRVVTRKEHR